MTGICVSEACEDADHKLDKRQHYCTVLNSSHHGVHRLTIICICVAFSDADCNVDQGQPERADLHRALG